MTDQEYTNLSQELQTLVKNIPLKWGWIQNDLVDGKIDMFSCSSLESLERAIQELSPEEKDYFRRRWFLWQCAQVDEYLFYQSENVERNPDHKDQSWDIRFNGSMEFDVKGTVVPKAFRSSFSIDPQFEEKIIRFYYDQQSRGVRHNIQNRLFIVHHSFRKEERSMYLRCHWSLKKEAYQQFNQLLSSGQLILVNHNNVSAKCIFIIEGPKGEFHFKII